MEPMSMSVPQKLQTYITAELHDAAFYRELSRYATNDSDRQLIMEFADDEQSHADTFKRIYRRLTGRSFSPVIPPIQMNGSVRDILRDRVLDESGDFRKYGEQYLMTNNDPELKNAYYRARTDENVHALRLLYLLAG